MRNITKLVLFLHLFIGATICSQDRKIKHAEKKFQEYAFMDAITSYEELVKQGFSAQEIYESLGNANYFNANYEEAANWYGKLVNLKDATIDKEYLYRYAQVLKSTGNYEKSDRIMERFETAASIQKHMNLLRYSLAMEKRFILPEITPTIIVLNAMKKELVDLRFLKQN